ncbi:MAG: heavy metal translocating P-type ATPase, partial [Burkholderiales bacterium]
MTPTFANPTRSPVQADAGPALLRFRVGGMDCASCAHKIETALRRIEGVTQVTVNVQGGAVGVRHDKRLRSAASLQHAIEALGYMAAADGPGREQRLDGAPVRSVERPWWRTPKGAIMLVAGMAVAAAFTAEWAGLGLGHWPFIVALALGLVPVAWRAFQAARAGSVLTIEMLMTIAALGALVIGAAEEAAMVVFLFSVGEFLEGVAAASARRSISALSSLAPVSAQLIEGEVVREVPAATLVPGQRVLVRSGDRIPCDGIIIEGATSVDESPINGESVPRAKEVAATVYAGTINLDAAIKVEATHSAEDNTIARVLRLVEEAQDSKAPVERFIDNFARIYMPVIVGLAIVVAIAPPLLAGAAWDVWIYRALALLL